MSRLSVAPWKGRVPAKADAELGWELKAGKGLVSPTIGLGKAAVQT